MGYELDAAGFPLLATEKYELAKKEMEICNKISQLLRLGHIDSVTIDSLDSDILKAIFCSTEIECSEVHLGSDPTPPCREEEQEEKPQKRQRKSDSPYDVLEKNKVDEIDPSQPIYTHTASEGDWQSPEKGNLTVSLPSQSTPSISLPDAKFIENDCKNPLDQSITGVLSQEANGNIFKSNDLNLSAISNSSSVHGSSLIHSTPSPELILQNRECFRRYHSDGIDRRNLSREYDSDHHPSTHHCQSKGQLPERDDHHELLSRRSITQ